MAFAVITSSWISFDTGPASLLLPLLGFGPSHSARQAHWRGLQVYYLWYGAWGNLNNNGTAKAPTTVKVLTDLAQSIGSKPWIDIVSTYYSGSASNPSPVTTKVTYGGRAAIPSGNTCFTVGMALYVGQGRYTSNASQNHAMHVKVRHRVVSHGMPPGSTRHTHVQLPACLHAEPGAVEGELLVPC